MKFLMCFVFVAALATTFVQGYPAQQTTDSSYDTEIVLVPLERQPNFNPNTNDFIDTGYVQPTYADNTPYYNPLFWNFGRFFEAFENMLRKMREQTPTHWAEDRITNDEVEAKGNTTSTVKIVDGHRVVINDTTYHKENQFGGQSLFRVRTINVQPLDSDEDNKDITTDGNVEMVSKDREGEDSDEDVKDNRESLEDKNEANNDVYNRDIDDNYQILDQQSRFDQSYPETHAQFYNHNDEEHNTDDLNEFVVENHEENNNNLESVNINENNNEEEDSREEMSEKFNVQKVVPSNNENWDSFEDFNNNGNNNDLDETVNLPIDLSNDIAVNQMLADQGAPHNPDAELFEVDNLSATDDDGTSLRFQPIK